MKILFVSSPQSVYGNKTNPFVSSLIEGLKEYGNITIDCDLDSFWNNYTSYDLIYFQWPERIFNWNTEAIDIKKLSHHFDLIKKNQIKTVITCHNLLPHNGNPKVMQLYDLVYSKVDAFHHLGKYSYQLMRLKYPNSYHFIAPHHVPNSYFDLYKSPHAKSKLSISEKEIVIASFGAFRNNDEKKLFLTMVDDTRDLHTRYLAPRLKIYDKTYTNWLFSYLKEIFFCHSKKIKTSGFLEEEKLKKWLSAADIVFIQRKDILNSGNLPLAFAAGKIVIGPNIGNVGEILKETGNFVFDPNDRQSIKNAVMKAIYSINNGDDIGYSNHLYAKKQWNVPRISKIIFDNIHQLMHD